MGVRKVLVVGALLALMMFVASPVNAQPTSPPARDVTLTATVTLATGWCCGTSTLFEGRAVIPRVGAVAFTGNWLAGCAFFPGDISYPCFRSLEIDFVSPNGDAFTLRGYDEWMFPFEVQPAQLSWAIDPASSTGRFTDLSGSGTYTVALDGLSVSVSLSGLIQHAAASRAA